MLRGGGVLACGASAGARCRPTTTTTKEEDPQEANGEHHGSNSLLRPAQIHRPDLRQRHPQNNQVKRDVDRGVRVRLGVYVVAGP